MARGKDSNCNSINPATAVDCDVYFRPAAPHLKGRKCTIQVRFRYNSGTIQALYVPVKLAEVNTETHPLAQLIDFFFLNCRLLVQLVMTRLKIGSCFGFGLDLSDGCGHWPRASVIASDVTPLVPDKTSRPEFVEACCSLL